MNLDEDSSAYESSFIDDSALHEDDEENAEDAPDENVANVADDDHADMDIEDDDDKPMYVYYTVRRYYIDNCI